MPTACPECNRPFTDHSPLCKWRTPAPRAAQTDTPQTDDYCPACNMPLGYCSADCPWRTDASAYRPAWLVRLRERIAQEQPEPPPAEIYDRARTLPEPLTTDAVDELFCAIAAARTISDLLGLL